MNAGASGTDVPSARLAVTGAGCSVTQVDADASGASLTGWAVNSRAKVIALTLVVAAVAVRTNAAIVATVRRRAADSCPAVLFNKRMLARAGKALIRGTGVAIIGA